VSNVFKPFLLSSLLFLSFQTSAFFCPDSGVFSNGKLMAAICWDCFFPMRILGNTFEANAGNGSGGIPEGAYMNAACVCTDENGIPEPGVHIGMWDVTHLIETVSTPYCSPFLGGQNLQGNRIATGGDVQGGESDIAFQNIHLWTFPIATILQLFAGANCNPGNLLQIDMSYMSEVDPLWNDEVLTVMVQPETTLFSLGPSQLACAAECTAMYFGDAVDFAPWCVGCWGGSFPSTGFDVPNGNATMLSSVLAAKGINAMHRRMLLQKTYGGDAMCGASLWPSLLKEQYRLGYVYPGIEANDNHQLGGSTAIWGWGMNSISSSHNAVQLLYRYKDCCTLF